MERRTHAPPALRLAALAVVAALTACASSGAGSQDRTANPFSQELEGRREVQIQVMNFNFSDATVWALARDGRRNRLGTVTGKTDKTFTIPWTFSEPMRIEFDLLADVRCLTEQIMVDPGDILEVQISVDPSPDPQCSRRR